MLQHRQLLAGCVELLPQLVHAFFQLSRLHVVGGVVTTHAYGFVEVEFTILQLAHAGQAFTQRIEAVGLGLQFAQACCHGVDFLLRAAAHLLQFGVLLVGPGLQQ